MNESQARLDHMWAKWDRSGALGGTDGRPIHLNISNSAVQAEPRSLPESVTLISRPDINPEQAGLLLNIAQEAKRVLGNRSTDSANFSESLGQTGVKIEYAYRSDKSKQMSSLTVRTDAYTQMRVIYDATRKIISLGYREELFGAYLKTTLGEDQDGNITIWIIIQMIPQEVLQNYLQAQNTAWNTQTRN
jgi:hypothetical protein